MKRRASLTDLQKQLLTRPISAVKLKRMWRSQWGLDVERFFTSPTFELVPVAPYNYYRFTSSHPGDAEFYSTLMRRMGYDHAEKAEFEEANLEISPGDKVLDVGSGIGNFSVHCNGQYTGLETNPAAVEDGQKLGRNVRLGYIQDEKPCTFDVVTVFQVLEHVEDPRQFITDCVKCLRPGGRLIVSTPNLNGFVGYLRNELLNYPPHHISWWSESSLKSLIEDCSCEVSEVWEEPLQRNHFSAALVALFWPRGQNHLTYPFLVRLVSKVSKIVTPILLANWKAIPFIKGHTIMVVARKMAE